MLPLSHQSAFVDTQAISLGASNGPMSDLRLAVKDLFDIEGLPTAAGNRDWLASHATPKQTNSSVLKLLQAGARYLGKTLTDELAYSLNGQNMHYPTLFNPITPERLPGGSSSGSAVAVALGAADIGLGTDTGGSIRVPASYNGLFGIRTSHAAIGLDNMVALAPSFDTVGWLANNLDTLQRVARCLLPMHFDARVPVPTKPRLLVLSNLIEKVEQAGQICDWLHSLKDAQCTHESLDVNALQTSETFRVLQGREIWQQHGQWITESKPRIAQDIQDRLAWCRGLNQQQTQEAILEQASFQKILDNMFAGYDAIVIPTTPGRAPLLSESASNMVKYRENLMALTAIAGLAGLPQIHLPLFSIDGAPCGLSLIGHKNSDLSLINLARVLIAQREPHLTNKDKYE